MAASYYVAVHQANWPTTAAINACLTCLDYPVRIVPALASDMDKPLQENNGALTVRFEGASVDLEVNRPGFAGGSNF